MLVLIVPDQLVHAQYSYRLSEQVNRLKFFTYGLAKDSLRGREAGTKEDTAAASLIRNYFRLSGLKPEPGMDGKSIFSFTDENGQVRHCANVIYSCGNKKGPVIIIGAHYDHIGMGGKLSRSPFKNEVHNGADDNASGVAVMMEVARQLALTKKHTKHYIFIAFDAHEPGLYGSANAARMEGMDSTRVKLMINLDMVGRMDSLRPVLYVAGDTGMLTSPAERFHLRVKELPEGDHSAFAEQGIPVLFLTTGMHDDYHTVNDDAEKLNYEGMQRIVDWIVQCLNQ